MRRVLAAILGATLLAACNDVLGVEEKQAAPAASSQLDARPPARPKSSIPSVPRKFAFAARRYYFGARDYATEAEDHDAWRRIGFDIDGVGSPGTGASVSCRPAFDGFAETRIDGELQRDNNFGSQFLFNVYSPVAGGPTTAEDGANESVSDGYPTLIMVIDHLNDGPDDTEVRVGLMVSSPAQAPSWDGYDRLSIDPRTVLPGSILSVMRFESAYLANNVLVSGDFNAPNDVPFLFPLDPQLGVVTLHPLSFTLSVELNEAHDFALESTLSMVLTVPDFVAAIDYYMTRAGDGICDHQELLEPIVRGMADLRSDARNFHDASGEAECDAVSVAFKIRWFPIRLPTISDLKPVKPNGHPCGL